MAGSSSTSSAALFPPLYQADVFACQCSSWLPKFTGITMKTTVISPLPEDFREYLESDGIMVPEGSEDTVAESGLSDSEGEENADSDGDHSAPLKKYAFPDLDVQIRKAIAEYGGAVFPKLNWTSPKDATWILNPSSPLKCISPADIYLYLKSSDFVGHDLDPEMVFDGCVDKPAPGEDRKYELELVLKKWYAVDRSREMRCFVRGDVLLGISQRDPNYYDFLSNPETQEIVRDGITRFWERNIKGKFPGSTSYTFDIILTRSLSSAHLVDFNPYAPRTDSLLFTYTELHTLFTEARSLRSTTTDQDLLIQSNEPQPVSASPASLPELRVITSADHPSATRNAPVNQHNMVPREALELSQGGNIDEFREKWADQIKRATGQEGDSDSSDPGI